MISDSDNTVPDPTQHHPQRTKRATIACIMGCTCAGKSTFLQFVKDRNIAGVGTVEVGKLLRAKYPPAAFQGRANSPAHAQEAWDLCIQGVDSHLNAGKTCILIDGQPRDLKQAHDLIALFSSDHNLVFVLLHAPLAERERRARAHRNDSPDNLELALARLQNDMILYYEITAMLALQQQALVYADTGDPVVSATPTFSSLLDLLLEHN